MNTFQKWTAVAGLLAVAHTAPAQNTNLHALIDQQADKLESKVIQWRRDIHQNPELSNREVKTAEKIAKHLKSLGFEVQTGVAKTGVVGILKGGQPGPVVALRADMDALPVTERNSLPFASKVKTTFNNQQVGVMHACGHDTHVAMLMGAAEILAQHKKDLKGTVKFIFQPAEEGAPAGEEGGADVMVAEGVLANPKVDAIFGIHINSATEVGTMKYRPQGTMASSDNFKIKVKGRQAHGAYPWMSVDPIVVSAQIINGIQTIVSRQMELTNEAAVITVGAIHGGVRTNIIPEEVEMIGTIRSLDPKMQDQLHEKLRRTAEMIAASAGATATVEIVKNTPITYNHEKLTAHMLPSLQTLAGQQNVVLTKAVTGAEDFAYYQQKVPGMFVFVGGMAKGQDPSKMPAHHTPDFMIDESGLKLGVRTLAYLAVDYLNNPLK
ncbi:N-acyl-L-amino acid amidohydrolase [Rufibacter radiotolerans]|uniref:N-acyl-L-amino acid amidohydrolase n=1 Tax=Rufibacter radiotolerans TaxID=1379910 RepID=A0A0H4W2H4_9BACT|nr:amidohydrolase [Rufibacter radiotolerans]AKQ44636.1 N-acyl-L-amino acid amidohydrolase [Rufibacter radiotolerans]